MISVKRLENLVPFTYKERSRRLTESDVFVTAGIFPRKCPEQHLRSHSNSGKVQEKTGLRCRTERSLFINPSILLLTYFGKTLCLSIN